MGFVCVGVSWVASSGKLLICWNSWIRWVICSASQKAFSSTWHPQPTAPHTEYIAWFFGFWLLSMLANNKMNYARNEMLAHEARETHVLTELSRTVRRLGLKTKAFNFSCPPKEKNIFATDFPLNDGEIFIAVKYSWAFLIRAWFVYLEKFHLLSFGWRKCSPTIYRDRHVCELKWRVVEKFRRDLLWQFWGQLVASKIYEELRFLGFLVGSWVDINSRHN